MEGQNKIEQCHLAMLAYAIKRSKFSITDFIQPSLVELQPNLDDFMDTLEPLEQDLLYTNLPPVPEECSTVSGASSGDEADLYRALGGATYQQMVPEPPLAPPPPPPKLLPIVNLQQSTYEQVTLKQEPIPVQYHNLTLQQSQTPQHFSYPHSSSSVGTLKSNISSYYDMPPPTPCSTYQHQQQLFPPHQPNPASNPPSPPANVYPVSQSGRATARTNSLPLKPDKQRLPQATQTQGSQPRSEDVFAVPKLKHRNRSRSGSCLVAPNKSHKPAPLLSTASDPALNITHSNSNLLAQLLTASCNTGKVYNSYRAAPPNSNASKSATGATLGLEKSASNSNLLQMTRNSIEPPSYNFNQNQVTSSSSSSNVAGISASQSVVYPNNNSGSSGSSSVRSMMQPVQLVPPAPDTFMFAATTNSRRSDKNHQLPMLPQSQSTPVTSELIISGPTPVALVQATQVNSALNSLSPLNVGSPDPLSPSSSSKSSGRRGPNKEHRRVCHKNAVQKRRCNIKNGFYMLHSLIPQLSQNPNVKLNKAAMLQKGAEYIRQLRSERNQLNEEMDNLRQQVECLNLAISNCQSMLPATGAPGPRPITSKMKEMYNEYVWARTQENWRFWILSLICEPLLVSFNNSVSTASLDDLYRSTLQWVEQHCSLANLRPVVLKALRHLYTSTDILSDPSKLPSEAATAAASAIVAKSAHSSSSNST